MGTLQTALDVLNRLEQLQGRTVKEALLEQNRDNPAVQAIIRLALGSSRYFVSPPHGVVGTAGLSLQESWKAFRVLTKRLSTREVTGSAALAEVQRLLASCPPDAAKWYTRILNHDLRIGVGVDIVKTIWGSDFLLGREAKTDSWKFNGCALAKPWEDVWPRGDAKYPLGVERKLDGERALIFAWPATGEIIVATRNAKRRNQIEQVPEFRQQVLDFVVALDQSHANTPMFIDGEFMAAGWNQTSSLVRRTKNFDPAGFLQHIRLMLFDWAPLASYLAGEFAVPWIKRKSMLILAAGGNHVRSTPIKFSPNISVLGHVVVYSEEQLQAEYNACLDAGHEGIVAKVMDAPELFKRTANNIKLKPSDTMTVTITGAVAGQGKHAPADPKFVRAVRKVLDLHGVAQDDGSYLRWEVADVETAAAALRVAVADDTDRRIELLDDMIELRHGARLGYFTALTSTGDEVHVGGGFKHKAGQDQRMDFWLRRDEMIGKKIDIKVQKDQQQVGVGRFNRFERVREDL